MCPAGKSKPRLVTSPNKLTTEGRNIRLTCKASGLPKPKLKWILPPYVRPGRKVLVDNDLGTVTIIGVEPGHMGAYRCTAENELGTDEKTVQLTVIHKHVISHPQQPINEPGKQHCWAACATHPNQCRVAAASAHLRCYSFLCCDCEMKWLVVLVYNYCGMCELPFWRDGSWVETIEKMMKFRAALGV